MLTKGLDTVVNKEQYSCHSGLGYQSDPFVLFSPNDNNSGGGYHCVVGSCQAKGNSWWDYNDPAGGP